MTYPSFPYLSNHQWLVFDDMLQTTAFQPDDTLAYQDSFIRWLPNLPTGQAVLHYYPIEQPTVLLGAKDTRLANLKAGLRFLEDSGYQYALRPHGGLGVVCDSGILNIGLASDLVHFPLSIDVAYEQMVQLIRQSLEPYGLHVESYEIPQSYCPGTYDLVVNGLKIGGIAQRRFKNGITTAAYLSVNGNQTQRAQLMATFYQTAQADDTYPHVQAEYMATIAELAKINLTMPMYKQALTQLIQQYSNVQIGDYHHPTLTPIYQKMQITAHQRTLKLKENQ